METADAIDLASGVVAVVALSWSIRQTLRVRRLEDIRDLLGEKETVAFAAVQLMRGPPIGTAKFHILAQASKLLRRLLGMKEEDYSTLFDAIICACVFESSDRARALLYDVIYRNLDAHDEAIHESFDRIRDVFCGTARYGLTDIKAKTEFDLENGKVRLMWVRSVLDYHRGRTETRTRRLCGNGGGPMPVKIGPIEPMSEEEFEEFQALRQQDSRKTDPAMVALLNEIATGQPVRVPIVEGQSSRGLRSDIRRAATSRGIRVETREGEAFVAVKKAEKPQTWKVKQASSMQRKRRGRPLKRQE